MSSLLPSDADDDASRDGEVRVVPLEGEEAARLINSLTADTARSTLTSLQREPATASELAEAVGTSLQNVRHHLERLRDVDLVRVVGTRYSVKGREMKIYGTAEESLVVCVGDDAERLRGAE